MAFIQAPAAGDRIGIVAPASPFDSEAFESGVAVLRSMGFHPVVPEAVKKKTGYLAGADKTRARLINDMFMDPSIRLIWCARGGYGSMRCLPFIDYGAVRANPKPFIGASDVTAMLMTLYIRCGIPVIHGPMVVSFAGADAATYHSARHLLFDTTVAVTIAADPSIVIRGGCVRAPVIGGNLTTLSHLMGTAFEPDFSGHLLFIEDIGEAPYRIDRMLTQMRMAGKLSNMAGLMLGRFSDCGRMTDIRHIIEDICSGLDIPILAGIPAGHGRPNLMVPMGVKAQLDADSGILSYDLPLFDNRTRVS